MGIESVNSNYQPWFLVFNDLRFYEGRRSSNCLRESRCLHGYIFLSRLPMLQFPAQISSQCHHAFHLHDCNVCCGCCDSFQLPDRSCSSCSCDNSNDRSRCHRIARDLQLFENIISKVSFFFIFLFDPLKTFSSKFDITKFWYIGAVAGLGMMLVWPWFWILGVSNTMYTVYCGFGVMLFTFYLGNKCVKYFKITQKSSLRHKDHSWWRTNGNRTRWLYRCCCPTIRWHHSDFPLSASNLWTSWLRLFCCVLQNNFMSTLCKNR